MKNLVLIILFSTNLVFGQFMRIEPLYPENGNEVTVSYNGYLVNENTRLLLIFYFSNNTHSIVKNLETEIKNGTILGKIIIPDSVNFFQIKVTNINEVDNNGGFGFGYNIFKDGKPIKGTFLRQATSIALNEYFFKGKIDYQTAAKLCELEFELNPELKERYLSFYLEILNKVEGNKELVKGLAIDNFTKIIDTGLNQKDAFRFAKILANNDFNKVDSLTSIIDIKYSRSLIQASKRIKDVLNITFSKPDSSYLQLLDIKNNYKQLSDNQIRFINSELLIVKFVKNDLIGFDNLLNQFLNNEVKELLFLNLADRLESLSKFYLENGKNIYKAKETLEMAIFYIEKASPGSEYHGSLLETYAIILEKIGQNDLALKNFKKAVTFKNFCNLSTNETYIKKMYNQNETDEVIKLGEFLILNNQTTPIIDSLYYISFLKKGNSLSELESQKSLLELSNFETYKNKVSKSFILKKTPDVQLIDLAGNRVNLSDLHGNIIILDFWATWCQPCIRAFPAMKNLINQYKSINFLFINCLENDENINRLEKIQKTIDKYDIAEFEILLGSNTESSNSITSMFGIESIPTKIIIDKKGQIRYQSTGFSSEDNLYKEIKAVLNLIEQEEK